MDTTDLIIKVIQAGTSLTTVLLTVVGLYYTYKNRNLTIKHKKEEEKKKAAEKKEKTIEEMNNVFYKLTGHLGQRPINRINSIIKSREALNPVSAEEEPVSVKDVLLNDLKNVANAEKSLDSVSPTECYLFNGSERSKKELFDKVLISNLYEDLLQLDELINKIQRVVKIIKKNYQDYPEGHQSLEDYLDCEEWDELPRKRLLSFLNSTKEFLLRFTYLLYAQPVDESTSDHLDNNNPFVVLVVPMFNVHSFLNKKKFKKDSVKSVAELLPKIGVTLPCYRGSKAMAFEPHKKETQCTQKQSKSNQKRRSRREPSDENTSFIA